MIALREEITQFFDIEVFYFMPIRDILVLSTDSGLKCFKRVDYSVETLLFIHGGKEHLVSRGFIDIDRFNLSKEGLPYVMLNDEIYVLTDWIDARECELENPIELKAATEKLAMMHEASIGYTNVPEGARVRDDLGKLLTKFEKRCNEFLRMRKMADKKRSMFDYEYLFTYSYYFDLAKEALEKLKNSNYLILCDEAREKRGFIHRDYSYHNILYTHDGDVYIIDFDYLTYDLRIVDLTSFMQKVLKRIHWDIKTGESILNWYSNVSPLSKDELELVYIILLFPYRYWKTCNRYYNGKKSWSEKAFTNKLHEVIAEKEFHYDFVRWLEKQI